MPNQYNKDFLTRQILPYLTNSIDVIKNVSDIISIIKGYMNKYDLSSFDVFSGSGLISRLFKLNFQTLYVNDINPFSKVINDCYLSNVREEDYYMLQYHVSAFNNKVINNKLNFRTEIANLPYNIQKYYLAPLIYQVSINKPDNLEIPLFAYSPCDITVLRERGSLAVKILPKVDLAYLDLAYKEQSNNENYTMLNKVATCGENFDKENLTNQDIFNIIKNIKSKYLLIAYNINNSISYKEIKTFLNKLGKTKIIELHKGNPAKLKSGYYSIDYLFLLEK